MSLFAAFIISATAAPAVLPQTVAFAASTAKSSLKGYKLNKDIEDQMYEKGEKSTPIHYSVTLAAPDDSYPWLQTLLVDRDVTVTYKNNDKIGTATATIKGIGDYKGSITVKFNIVPSYTKSFSAKKNGKKVDFTWDKVAGVDGYDIYASKNGGEFSLFTSVKKNTSKTTVNRNLNNTKINWNFAISAYKMVGGKKYSSTWMLSNGLALTSKKDFNISVEGKQINANTATLTLKGIPNPEYYASRYVQVVFLNDPDKSSLEKDVEHCWLVGNYYGLSFNPESMDCNLYRIPTTPARGKIKSIKTTKDSITYTFTNFKEILPYLKNVPSEVPGIKSVSAINAKYINISVFDSNGYKTMCIQNFEDIGEYHNTNKGEVKITNKWTLK